MKMKDLMTKKEVLKKSSTDLIVVVDTNGDQAADDFIEKVEKAEENQWCGRCYTAGNTKVDVTGLKNCPRCGSRIAEIK